MDSCSSAASSVTQAPGPLAGDEIFSLTVHVGDVRPCPGVYKAEPVCWQQATISRETEAERQEQSEVAR